MVQHKINKKITISIFASRVIVVTAAPTENHMGVDIVKRVTTIMVIVMIFSIIDIIEYHNFYPYHVCDYHLLCN